MFSIPPQNGKHRPSRDVYPEDFEQFWHAYPPPRRVGPQSAYSEWTRAKDRPPIGEIVRVLRLQASSADWTKDSGQYVPHPERWIKKGKWLDAVVDKDAKLRDIREKLDKFDRMKRGL